MAAGPGSGFGDAAAAYISGLRAAGIPVTWTPMGYASTWGDPNRLSPLTRPETPGIRHADIANLPIDYDVLVMHGPPLWHEGWARQEPQTTLVACTAWEPDHIPPDRVELLNRYDAVLVPSRFNRDVFLDCGVTVPVSVVPHIARHPEPGPPLHIPGLGPDTFVFYVIGPWITRKAMADTISAYLEAFSGSDDVMLVVKTTPEDHIVLGRQPTGKHPAGTHEHRTWHSVVALRAGRPDPPKMHLSVGRWPQSAIDALHARADCLVCLSRAEGWGLTAFDAGIHGNPVVITGWGGSLEFLPADYPYLIDYDLVPTDHDSPDDWIEVAPDRRWAKARPEHAIDLLRQVRAQPDLAKKWGSRLRQHIVPRYSSTDITQKLLTALHVQR
jgi:glycosyltransferase involved in cell wall biosynthesis